MLRKCYNRNTFVTNGESGKNLYNVESGTKKDITSEVVTTMTTRQRTAPSSAIRSYTRVSELASCKLGAGELKGEATMKKFYKVEGISKDGHKVIDCTCYTTKEDAEKAIATGNYLIRNNKVYAHVTEIEA